MSDDRYLAQERRHRAEMEAVERRHAAEIDDLRREICDQIASLRREHEQNLHNLLNELAEARSNTREAFAMLDRIRQHDEAVRAERQPEQTLQ
jgi:hypothetical protein